MATSLEEALAAAPSAERRQTVELGNGETLGYLEYDTGSPVVPGRGTALLVHGNLLNARAWDEVMAAPAVREALAGWRVISAEMRGFGLSSYSAPVTSHADNAADLHLLLERLGLLDAPVLVVGWSTGGAAALELAAALGPRAAGLVMWASVGVRGLAHATREESDAVARTMLPVVAGGAGGPAAFAALWNAAVAQHSHPSHERMAVLALGAAEQRPECLMDVMWCNSSFDAAATAARVACPALVLHGRDDVVLPPAAAAEPTAAALPRARLVLVEGATHDPMQDRPDECAAALASFVGTLSRASL